MHDSQHIISFGGVSPGSRGVIASSSLDSLFSASGLEAFVVEAHRHTDSREPSRTVRLVSSTLAHEQVASEEVRSV